MSQNFFPDHKLSFSDPPTVRPRCPHCHSADIAVATTRSPSTYRRCQACGQLWHPDRLPARGAGRR